MSILHDCRHPNVVLMLGAWLGLEQLYMILELMHTDLWHALDSVEQQPALHWNNRQASGTAGLLLHMPDSMTPGFGAHPCCCADALAGIKTNAAQLTCEVALSKHQCQS